MKRDEEYIKALDKILDEIYEAADDLGYSWAQLAEKSGLAENTVWRNGNRLTDVPQFRTVFKLAKAVGLRLTLIQKSTFRIKKAG